ncbi:hypothetical protein HRbin35_00642 [bacterium HR35]|nr:hypothetical protein HRbin35_00642 [bacterium HR35]
MKKIIIYSASWCPWCRKMKEFLNKLNLEYEERDVDQNLEWRNELFQKTGQMGIPVTIVIDNNDKEHLIIGYDPASLMEIISQEKNG